MQNQLALAIEVATKAHLSQKRKTGEDYINHSIRVKNYIRMILKEFNIDYLYESFISELEIIAVLHDTLEDTNLSIQEIKNCFGITVALGVEKLTRKNGETYFDFIKRISYHFDASVIKLADLRDNMSDLNEGSLKDKYRFAEHYLIDNLEVNS